MQGFFLLLMGFLIGSLTVNSETPRMILISNRCDRAVFDKWNGAREIRTITVWTGAGVAFDEENYVNYADEAYLKRVSKKQRVKDYLM